MFMLPLIGPWLFRKGIKGTLSAVIQGGVLIFIALMIFLAYSSIKGHFDNIKKLEDSNRELEHKVVKTEGQRNAAIQLNQDNVKTLTVSKEIQNSKEQIAGEERAAATARAQTYKEINHAIRNTPTAPVQPGQPRPTVAPVVTRTLDSLWNH